MQPLFRQTVLVMRPRAMAGALAKALRRQGARVTLAPAIRIAPPVSWKPLDGALREFKRFDALVFTSANAVEKFFERTRSVLGRVPLKPPRLYAIGPATARALRAHDWRCESLPEIYEGSALARRIRARRGERILIPRAEKGGTELPRILRRAGARVSVVSAYRTLPDRAGLRRIRAIARENGVSWVAFTSASTVENFFFALGARQARKFFSSARAASIGPITSAALRRHGIEPAAQAQKSTSAHLARAIAASTSPRELAALRATLVLALEQAGEILRRRFGKVSIRYKGRANIVTEADHASERRILRIILSRFPDHDFMTEERPPRSSGSDFLWIMDPLDGTTNYAHGFPVACVSIGLFHHGRPLLAGVYDPFRREMFLAQAGKGTTMNGKPLSVSRVDKISNSLLLTGFPYDRAERSRYYVNFYRVFMERCHDVRRSGSAALDLAWTAAGRVEGYWEFNLSPWDVAAGMLLVQEAGGQVTDFPGNTLTDPRTLGRQMLATNGLVHAEMLRILRRHL